MRAAIAVALTLVSVYAESASRVSITVTPQTSFAPTELRIKAQIARDENNRGFGVWIDGENFHRSSEEQMEGAAAPITYWFRYTGVPAGEYEVGVAVVNSLGREVGRATQNISVITGQ